MESKLYTPAKVGAIEVKNRVFMAPMTRNRAGADGVQSEFAAEYYAQRASAGLIITEGSQVDIRGGGFNTPGIHSPEQTRAWAKVTDAVHEAGGKIVLQLWHVGRITSNAMMPGETAPRAPSAIQANHETVTKNGREKCSQPRAFTEDEIWDNIESHRLAALNAKAAGFDGVELHGANGYLLDQFMCDGTNQRTDKWGGSAEKRCRFLVEVMDRVSEIWGADRVGVRFSPTGVFNDMSDSDPVNTFGTAIEKLNDYGASFLHLVEQFPYTDQATEAESAIIKELKSMWKGFYIANGGFTKETGEAYLDNGDADAIAYGRPFIANPDLPVRLERGAQLNEPDRATIYGGDYRGYTDYPFLGSKAA